MKILALDLATQTGWCFGETSERPTLGTLRLPSTGDEVGPFLDFFDQWLTMKFKSWDPAVVIFEAPILPGQFGNNSGPMTSIKTTRKLQGLASHLEFVCQRRSLECLETASATAKKAVGSGKFKKPDVLAACKRCGFDPKSQDEADAFAIWMAGLRELDQNQSGRWDSLLLGGAQII